MKICGKYFRRTLAAIAFTTLFVAGTASAQTDNGAPPPPPPGKAHRGGPGGPGGPGDEIRFIGFEMGLDGKTVTGAPFSATFSTQSTNSLSDGNKISTSSSGTVARDSQGRTRREMTLPAIGPWATSGNTPPHVVLLSDPVAGTHYVLDTNRKVAIEGHKGGRGGPGDEASAGPWRGAKGKNVVTTDLGTQTINGISAQGTRYTRTIPAGEIGNEKPIEVVTERWYSPELQINVMTKHSDPRNGETVTQLTEIQRQDPDASQFQVPAGYSIRQGRRGGPPKGPAPSNPPSDEQ